MLSNEFKSYVIIEFDSKCSDEVKRWLIGKLSTAKTAQGAQLAITLTRNSKNEDIYLHLSADFNRYFNISSKFAKSMKVTPYFKGYLKAPKRFV